MGQSRVELETSSYRFQRELERLLSLLAKRHSMPTTKSENGKFRGGQIAEAHFVLAAQLRKNGVLVPQLQSFEGDT